MKNILITGIITLFSLGLAAQRVQITVLDSLSMQPLSDVHIEITGTLRGGLTNQKGQAYISLEKKNQELRISHLNYHTKTLNNKLLSPENRILLSPRTYNLPSVSIETPAPKSLTKNKPWFVKDYIILDSNILVLTYVNQRFSRSHIALITLEGDCLTSTPLPYANEFYTDALGNHFVFDRHLAWQIFFDGHEIQLLYPSEKTAFIATMSPLLEAHQPNFYLRFYTYGKHRAHFLIFNETDTSYKEFHSISSETGMNMYDDMPRMLYGASESAIRFEMEIMHRPLNVPLYLSNDTVYIIDPVNSELHSFSSGGELLQSLPQDLSEDKSWKGNLILDHTNKKIYSLHTADGYTQLKERKPEDLHILSTLSLPKYPFLEKVQVKNENIYFLYKDFCNQEFKQLYCLKR